MVASTETPSSSSPVTVPIPELIARDAMIGWFRGEFAAANAIIDALCSHIRQMDGGDLSSEYNSVFAAIHRRRMNWIPILHMQKYFSIAEVSIELRRVSSKMREEAEKGGVRVSIEDEEVGGDARVCSDPKVDDEGGSQGGHLSSEKVQICANHEDCLQRSASIKTTKGFVAKEPVKGHMVNVVKGLKLYEDIFIDTELSKLVEFINELRLSGRKGDLSGETFIFFNQQLKGNRRELIQLGVPIFGQINEEATGNIEPIPSVLQAVIDHLVLWRLIPESRKPNSCIISFFDEGEYSQPYLKPPHLDPPISTLLLSESTMAFGRALVRDPHGNFKGPLMLSLKEGSLLVMRGNSAEVARHVMCPSSNQRVNITFVKVQPPATKQIHPSVIPPLNMAMTAPQPLKMPSGPIGYEAMGVVPRRGVFHAPLVMLAPARPMVMGPTMFVGPRRIRRGGTGVFLPWTVGPKKSTKHLPPRVRRERLLLIPPSTEMQAAELSPEPEVAE